MRVGIAGAGLLGRLLACKLAAEGVQVDLFDPATGPAARGAAGWTAAGMLSPVAELESADETVFALGMRSLRLWPQLLSTLDQPVAMQQRGSLLLAHRGDEGAARRVVDLLMRKAAAEYAPRPLTTAALSELEPALHGAPHAWLLPQEGQIDTVQAMTAMTENATRLGVCWHWQTPVSLLSAGCLQTQSQTHHFDHVFDVRGTGAGDQTGAHGKRVRGVRGEIFWLHAPGVRLQRPLRLLHPRHRVYLVPREGDLIVVGASEIESEDRSPVSLRSTVELLAAAHSVLPELAEARLVHSETNLRPALPDNLPRIEQSAGLTRINGLFRHGWLIAPALVEDALRGLAHRSTTNPLLNSELRDVPR